MGDCTLDGRWLREVFWAVQGNFASIYSHILQKGLTRNGCIILKENHSSSASRDFDSEDYSWTRTHSEFLSLFEEARLDIVYEKKQQNFPKGMLEVRMYALKPMKDWCCCWVNKLLLFTFHALIVGYLPHLLPRINWLQCRIWVVMITALKKKFAPPPGSSSNNRMAPNCAIRTGGVVPINTELQKKFAHGVNFNRKHFQHLIECFGLVKVVIRGDRASGKTCLFRRLQGQLFDEAYLPTEEIQVANILWNYKTTDHIVKLDVWDVVDTSSRRTTKKIDGLKLENNSMPSTSVNSDLMICDATFIDVFKDCHGVLLMFDITKRW